MNQQQNQINLNLHPQRLIALAIAAAALIFMFLTWSHNAAQGFTGESGNGFGDFGLLTAAGILGVIIACFLGNKAMPFDKQTKMIALGAFAAIALGAIGHFIYRTTQGGKSIVSPDGFNQYEVDIKASTGIGTWLALAAGLIGLAVVSGILNQVAASSRTTSSAPMSTPPTPPGAPPPPPPPPTA
jgi:hypothetical protein